MPPLGASVPPQGAVMVLNRWLLERDWCPLEPFAAAGPIAVAGPIAAGPEPVAAGAGLVPLPWADAAGPIATGGADRHWGGRSPLDWMDLMALGST